MHKRHSGFTLIELLIVVAIVGILATIVIPSYNQYVLKTRRTEAFTALLRLANEQEKHFLNNNQYATSLGSPENATTIDFPATSENGFFNISIAVNGANIELHAKTTGAQTTDTTCDEFIFILPAGTRTSEDNTNAVNPAGTCW